MALSRLPPIARKKLQLSQKRQADEYDRKSWGTPYNQGDRVWLFNPSTPCGLSPKLTSHWTGPYIVKQNIHNTNYVIHLEAGRKVLTVHHNRLKPCYTPKKSAEASIVTPEMQLHSEEPRPEPQSTQKEELEIGIIPNQQTSDGNSQRPRRNRQPPNRYGNVVYDSDELIP